MSHSSSVNLPQTNHQECTSLSMPGSGCSRVATTHFLGHCYSAHRMNSIDKFTLSLSILGIYGLFFCLRYLIPCYATPLLSARLNETRQLLDHAEAINAIPPECEYRTHLDLYGDLSLCSSIVLSYTGAVQQPDSRLCVWRAITHGGPSSNCALLLSAA